MRVLAYFWSDPQQLPSFLFSVPTMSRDYMRKSWLQLLMLVTAEKEGIFFRVFFLSIFCQLMSPWFRARTGWVRLDQERSGQLTKKSALSCVVSSSHCQENKRRSRKEKMGEKKKEKKCVWVVLWGKNILMRFAWQFGAGQYSTVKIFQDFSKLGFLMEDLITVLFSGLVIRLRNKMGYQNLNACVVYFRLKVRLYKARDLSDRLFNKSRASKSFNRRTSWAPEPDWPIC